MASIDERIDGRIDERIDLVRGDITAQRVDAIVNAANEGLLGGGGVDGAIHRAAGRALIEACRAIPEVRPGVRCPTGEVRVTEGFALPARWVIHAVGPVWAGGGSGEAELLAACYRNALAAAAERGVRSIAFPAISTGLFRFPHDLAARVAVREVRAGLAADASIERALFVCFDDANHEAYRQALGRGG